ncbi:TPA: hypothetical protein VBN14_001754 [Streptococcus agalactiae]|nr:hypothetical protein [Streptococcus agalactiae]HEO7923673.1 hypothetical protein [Streptococcus agalactiae]
MSESIRMFDEFNKILQKTYGKQASKDTYNRFVVYCSNGIMIDGVKPIFNPFNLFAYGMGITSDEADKIRFNKLKNEEK